MKVGDHGFRIANDIFADDFLAEGATDDFDGGDKRGSLCRAEALLPLQGFWFGRKKSTQAAVFGEELPG